jgi:hypothetical protein
MIEKEEGIIERINILRDIDEKILKSDKNNGIKEIGGGTCRKKTKRNSLIIDAQPKIKKTHSCASLPELSLSKETSNNRSTAKFALQTFNRFKTKMIEKFIPKSLNQNLFESDDYLHISSNNRKSLINSNKKIVNC